MLNTLKQADWEPLWTGDESIFSRNSKNDLFFHKSASLDDVEVKYANQRVVSHSLSPAASKPFYVLCYIPGKQGSPSLGKLFEYPKFDNTIASKSFFQVRKT